MPINNTLKIKENIKIQRVRKLFTMVLSLLFLFGCDTETEVSPYNSMIITPSSVVMPVGITQQLTATVLTDYTDAIDVTEKVTWISGDVNIIDVDDKGLIKAVNIGEATITARLDHSLSQTITVSVIEGQLNSIQISPSIIPVGRGMERNIEAIGIFDGGVEYDLTHYVTWTIADNYIASIENGTGIVKGLNNGNTAIVATFDSVNSEPATISVNSIAIASSYAAFSAIKADKTVVSWGDPKNGGENGFVADLLTDAEKIYGGSWGFAVINGDHSLVSWGTLFNYDNYIEYSDIIDVAVNPVGWAFAAIKMDGSVVTWGDPERGGDSASVAHNLNQVEKIYPASFAFAALKKDGSVVTWGDQKNGGDNSRVAHKLLSVKDIFPNYFAFAALKHDGKVVTWGFPEDGGDSSLVESQLTDVQTIASTNVAFAALKKDGRVVSWGMSDRGGDSSQVKDQLKDVKEIYSNYSAFAALKKDGSVVTWGADYSGGDSSLVQSQLKNIKTIYSTGTAFAAITRTGNVVTWGNNETGGNSYEVQSQLTNIDTIFSTIGAFAALKKDGSVVTWGHPEDGADSYFVQPDLYNIVNIFSVESGAFAALRQDGVVITWGNGAVGGDSSYIDLN